MIGSLEEADDDDENDGDPWPFEEGSQIAIICG